MKKTASAEYDSSPFVRNKDPFKRIGSFANVTTLKGTQLGGGGSPHIRGCETLVCETQTKRKNVFIFVFIICFTFIFLVFIAWWPTSHFSDDLSIIFYILKTFLFRFYFTFVFFLMHFPCFYCTKSNMYI